MSRMKRALIVPVALAALLAGGAMHIVQDQCGPFTDVTPAFCPFILELYYLGITVGTSSTTFSPDDPLTRGQGAVFVAKGLNQALARSSRRAALGQWWTTTPHWDLGLGVTDVGPFPTFCASDGADVWVANEDFGGPGSVSRVRASDGRLLETWTGATGGIAVLSAMGRIFVAGASSSMLFEIDPSQPAGAVTPVAALGNVPQGLAFDGARIWSVNNLGSVSIVTPGTWSVTNVPGFSAPLGIVYDGANIWITDATANTLLKLDANGAVLQTVPVGSEPLTPVFDGANIWVPNLNDNTVSVVSAASGVVLATLSGNGLVGPTAPGFDGRRVLITNEFADTVSLWNAADLTPLGSVSTGTGSRPLGVCGDGVNFWIPLSAANRLARF